ncbi:MAG TPA: hypothetical protein PKD90_14315 [Phnomibacter sp.]|nr:hypothetical protein [Phnomibacter sp.]
MATDFYLALAAILLIPLIPAFIIYKFLPASETDVSGPYQKLNLKLKGAFAGYFLLVLIGLTLKYAVMNNRQAKQIEQLEASLAQRDSALAHAQEQLRKSPVVDWHVKGIVHPGEREGTRFFYDDGTTVKNPDGSFELIKRSVAAQGPAKPPKWICVYNPLTGYRVVSLNREVNHPDIDSFKISFNDAEREIIIGKRIEINSQEKDSIMAVTGFLNKNPNLKQEVFANNPTLFVQAEKIKLQQTAIKANHLLRTQNTPVQQ